MDLRGSSLLPPMRLCWLLRVREGRADKTKFVRLFKKLSKLPDKLAELWPQMEVSYLYFGLKE